MLRCGLLLFVAMMLAVPSIPQASAQPAGNAYYIVTYIEVASRSQRDAADLIRQFGETSRKDAGNLRFETLRRIGRPRHFAILEAWTDKAAADAHAAADHTKQFRDALKPMQTAPYDERPHGALAVASPKLEPADRRVIYVVTHVDIIPPKKDDGIAATSGLAEPGRKERGNLRFEVLQQTSRPNHMTVVEAWGSRRAQRAHATADNMKAYRDQLLPMSGSLYDERLYLAIGEGRRSRRK